MALDKNEKQITEEQLREKIYLPVGYPLRFECSEDVREIQGNNYVFRPKYYLIERYSDTGLLTVKLSLREVEMWTHIFTWQDEDIREEHHTELLRFLEGVGIPELLGALKLKNVLIEANSHSHLLEQMLHLKPSRQGMGWIKGNKGGRLVGRAFIHCSLVEEDIWDWSDEQNSINDIFLACSKKNKKALHLFENDFTLAVLNLIKHGYLILR